MLGSKLLLTAVALIWLFPAVAVAGKGGEPQQEQMAVPQAQAQAPRDDDGMSPEVLAALIAGGLGLCGAVITTVAMLQNRKKG